MEWLRGCQVAAEALSHLDRVKNRVRFGFKVRVRFTVLSLGM